MKFQEKLLLVLRTKRAPQIKPIVKTVHYLVT